MRNLKPKPKIISQSNTQSWDEHDRRLKLQGNWKKVVHESQSIM